MIIYILLWKKLTNNFKCMYITMIRGKGFLILYETYHTALKSTFQLSSKVFESIELFTIQARQKIL